MIDTLVPLPHTLQVFRHLRVYATKKKGVFPRPLLCPHGFKKGNTYQDQRESITVASRKVLGIISRLQTLKRFFFGILPT